MSAFRSNRRSRTLWLTNSPGFSIWFIEKLANRKKDVKLDFRIKPVEPGDMPEAHGLTAEVAWPHTLDDLRFAASIGSGFAARDNDSGTLVGLCLTWQLGDAVATLGLLIVSPAVGGKGLGRKLLRRCLADQSDRTVLLHATAPAVALYNFEGFRRIGWIRQVQGHVSPNFGSLDCGLNSNIQPLSAKMHSELLKLDCAATGYDRSAVLLPLLDDQQTSGLVLIQKAESAGYALCRPFGCGMVIGPVVAGSEFGAKSLVANLLSNLKGKFVRLDLTDNGIDSRWLAGSGLSEVDRVEVMVRATMPETGSKMQKFALIGHAFG